MEERGTEEGYFYPARVRWITTEGRGDRYQLSSPLPPAGGLGAQWTQTSGPAPWQPAVPR